ncbi:MAG: oligosaccharide flippase family protein [Pseudomonadota bacterium]|nr:oligosaccharide flippase family protein [Pseudomonadota bacterium]
MSFGDTQPRTLLYTTPDGLERPLRVALVAVREIPGWVRTFRALALENDWIDLVAVEMPGAEVLPGVPDVSLDLRAFLACERAVHGFTGTSLVPGPIKPDSAKSMAEQDTQASLLMRIGAMHPDVVILLGPKAWASALAAKAPWGCWHVEAGLTDQHHAGLSLLAPMLRGETATQIALVLRVSGQEAIHLAGSWGRTRAASFLMQREDAFRKLPPLLLRALRRLAAGKVRVGQHAVASIELQSSRSSLGRAAGLRALTSTMCNAVRSVIGRSRNRNRQWMLALRHGGPNLDPGAPVIGPHTILKASKGWWADPCVVVAGGRRLLFLEEMADTSINKGTIACVELFDGAARRLGVVIEEPGHLSFPQPFLWEGQWYLTVESSYARRVGLYRATKFPMEWARVRDLVTGRICVDPSLHHHDGHWYLFANVAESGNSTCDDLFLFVAESLEGPFRPHPASPIVSDVRRARLAGRLFHDRGRLIRPAQDCTPIYGKAVVFNEVLELSPKVYRERPLSRLEADWASTLDGCHTYTSQDGVEVLDVRGRPPADAEFLLLMPDGESEAPAASVCLPAASASAPASAVRGTDGDSLSPSSDEEKRGLTPPRDSVPMTRKDPSRRMWLGRGSAKPATAQAPDGNLPPPRQLPGIGTHYLRYSMSNGVILLAGFISFPVLTRFLDNTQFGILRYYDTLMLLGVALMKLGSQHSIVRFYPYNGDPHNVRVFGTNLVMMPLMMSGTLWLLCAIGLLSWWWSGGTVHPVFWGAMMLMPMLATGNVVQMVARASERSDIVMNTRIAGRMLELLLVMGAVILVQRSALAVYGGKIIATALLLVWLLSWMRRNLYVSRDAVDRQAFRTGLIYGLPLMAQELAHGILNNFDRVLLKEITGDFAAVGIYAIGYALAMQVNVFISTTLSEAFTPVVTRAFETGGSSAVLALKERVLLPMTYAVVAIVAMLLISGQDLLVALSGPEKAASGEVFVVVGITLSLYALFAISNYGLLLKKRTMLLLAIVLGAAGLNVAMNFLLIPAMGYMGAAWATVGSYTALSIALFITCPKGLARLPDARSTILSLSCAALLAAVAFGSDMLGLEGAWPRLVGAGMLFLLLYALPVLALDPTLRYAVQNFRKPAT